MRSDGEVATVQVGVLTTGFPRYQGDLAGNFIYFCCRALQGRGFSVTVLTPHTRGTSPAETLEGIAVRRFRYLYPSSLERVAYESGTPANLGRSWLAWVGLPLFALSFWLHARRLARCCQLLHAHWIPSGLVALTCAPFGRRPPVIVSVWGSDLALARLPILGRLILTLLRHASAVMAVSDTMKRELLSLGLPEDKVVVVPTAVSPLRGPEGSKQEVRRELGLPPDQPLALYLGRLSPVKGPGYFVEAARLVLNEAPDAGFVVVGDGHLRPQLEASVRAMGIGDRFFFAGDVPHDEVGHWLTAADLFVLPSLSEGMPHALLEALSFGLPVVASAVGGVAEIVRDEVNGYLVPPTDTVALARHIVLLLRDPPRRRALGEAGRRVIEERRLTWDRFAAEVAEIYERTLASAPHGDRRPRPWIPL